MIKKLTKFILTLSPALFLLACGEAESPKKDLGQTVVVKTVIAEVQPLELQSTYSGTVEPIERVRLSTKIMGWVDKIYHDEGSKFKKGDLLVTLQNKDLEAKRAQAQAGISAATVQFENMKTNLKRIEALFEKGAATQKELDDTRTGYASAEAQKIQAEKMKIEVDEMLKYANITAPFDGAVSRKMVQMGDMANPGHPILEIENASQVKIVAKVPESEVQELKVGMPAWVKVQASEVGTNGKSTQGKVSKIVPSADPMSRQFEIEVVMDNPDGKMLSGMFARVAIGLSESSALLVPQAAVFRRGQLEGLFTVDAENKARLRWIRTGEVYKDKVNVLSGLNPGETVVVDSETKLLDGQSVEVN